MIVHEESRLRFAFDSAWRPVLPWDRHPAHVRGLQQHHGTAAVDFCALFGSDPYLIEVKNFCDFRIENKARLSSGELARAVACKVRDTIASCVWAQGREHAGDDLERFVRNFFDAKECSVVLWLEEDLPPRPADRRALELLIKRHLRWLNPLVSVRDRQNPLPNLVVSAQPSET